MSDFTELSNFTVLSDFSDSELFTESCEQVVVIVDLELSSDSCEHVVDFEFLDNFESLELGGFEL